MDQWFPKMDDRPDNGQVLASAIYWGFCYFIIPAATTVISWAFSSDVTAVIGIDRNGKV